MSSSNHRGSGAGELLAQLDSLVTRLLRDVGHAQWGSTFGLWPKYTITSRLYPDSGYWWVAGNGARGSGYQWDVYYEAGAAGFRVGHARGDICTDGTSERALRAALQEAVALGPIEQIPPRGYVT